MYSPDEEHRGGYLNNRLLKPLRKIQVKMKSRVTTLAGPVFRLNPSGTDRSSKEQADAATIADNNREEVGKLSRTMAASDGRQ